MERSVKQASQAVAQAMLCQRAIQELHGKGVVYLTSLQDIPNDADDEAVAQAVVQRKATLALQHDAGEWLEEKVRAFPGSDQLKRLLGRNPLKRALDDFAFKVKVRLAVSWCCSNERSAGCHLTSDNMCRVRTRPLTTISQSSTTRVKPRWCAR